MSRLSLDVSSASRRGSDHTLFEDAVYYVSGEASGVATEKLEQHGLLLAIADGEGGALAAPLLRELPKLYYDQLGGNVAENLRRAIHEANARICAAVDKAQLGARGNHSTLVIVVVKKGLVYVANVGNSRAYLWRLGELWPLTRDHVDDEGRPTRLLGASTYLEPDIFLPLELEDGDRLLLCSDGLVDSLAAEPTLERLLQRGSAGDAAEALVTEAEESGAHDDVSVIVALVRPGSAGSALTFPQALLLLGMLLATLLLLAWFLVELWWTIQ